MFQHVPPYQCRILTIAKEFLGHWTNISGHVKAADQILRDLYTPETIMQDEAGRTIATWYIRFDFLAAIMNRNRPELSCDWISAYQQHCKRHSTDRPHDLPVPFGQLISILMQVTTDSISLMLLNEKEINSNDGSRTEPSILIQKYDDIGPMLEGLFAELIASAQSDSEMQRRDASINFNDPSPSYDNHGETPFMVQYLTLDFWVMLLMFRYQGAIAQQREPIHKTEAFAVQMCKLVEELEGCQGALLGCAASLGLAGLFLPRHKKFIDWCRGKYASIEKLGWVRRSEK